MLKFILIFDFLEVVSESAIAVRTVFRLLFNHVND